MDQPLYLDHFCVAIDCSAPHFREDIPVLGLQMTMGQHHSMLLQSMATQKWSSFFLIEGLIHARQIKTGAPFSPWNPSFREKLLGAQIIKEVYLSHQAEDLNYVKPFLVSERRLLSRFTITAACNAALYIHLCCKDESRFPWRQQT